MTIIESQTQSAANPSASTSHSELPLELAASNDIGVAEELEQTTSQRSSLRQTVFEPWSKKPTWFLASRPPTISLSYPLWLLYGLLQLFRVRWIPVPRHWGSSRRRERENYAFMYQHEHESMGIFSVLSLKGGALKSTVLTWMAATYARCTKGTSMVLDVDSGALESAAKRLETFSPENATLLNAKSAGELILYGNWQPHNEDLLPFVPRSFESGVYVLSMSGITNWSAQAAEKILRTHKRACGSLFVDTGPGEKEPNTRGIAKESTVVTVTGIFQNVSTDDAIKMTLNSKKYNLRSRRDYVVIAIGAVGWRHFNKRTQYELASQFDVSPDQIVLLPDHRRIRKAHAVRLGKISRKFLYAMSVLNRTRVEAAIEYNRKNRMPFPAKQSPMSLQEQKEGYADGLLYMHRGDASHTCEYVLNRAEETTHAEAER